MFTKGNKPTSYDELEGQLTTKPCWSAAIESKGQVGLDNGF